MPVVGLVQRTTLTRMAHAVLGSDDNRQSLRPLPTSEIKRSQAGAERWWGGQGPSPRGGVMIFLILLCLPMSFHYF